jgi:CheY-like chemotaxis protein
LQREREMKEELAAANRTKDEFLAMVSHELRTPLNSMLGWARLLRAGMLDQTATAHAVEVIESSAKAQARLIEDLLDISRITTGKLRLSMGTVEPASVIQAALDAVRPAAEAKGVQLATRIIPKVGPVTGDQERLQQVFWNLLANAVKFTPKGGRVEVQLGRAGSQLEIVVSDTGQGISPEFLPYVFERFRQADGSITRAHGGLGLGLSIARHLVEMHGGTIRAESGGEGQGASFRVRLPFAPTHWEVQPFDCGHLSGTQGTAPADLPRLDGLHVLVVDDDPNTGELITTLLTQYGAEARSCTSAAEARQLLADWRPDVLISDVGMPGEDGYEFIRQLRAAGPVGSIEIPAVALTAYARLEDRRQALQAGFQMHIAKPAEPSELLTIITSLVQRTGKAEL